MRERTTPTWHGALWARRRAAPRWSCRRPTQRAISSVRPGPAPAAAGSSLATRGLPGVGAAMYPWNRLGCAAVLLVLPIGVEKARGDDSRRPASVAVEG